MSVSSSPHRMKLCKHISVLVTWNGNRIWVCTYAFETRVGKHLFHSILKPQQTWLADIGVMGVCDIWFRDLCYRVAEECQYWRAEMPPWAHMKLSFRSPCQARVKQQECGLLKESAAALSGCTPEAHHAVD